MTLAPIDATSEVAVSDYLTMCRDWLATCVEMTGPEQIAAAKAEIATAAEATKQLGLSKEIQLDAQEMVRRAEYALGKAVRLGQAAGSIRKLYEPGPIMSGYHRADGSYVAPSPTRGHGDEGAKTSPLDIFVNSKERDAAYAMSDSVPVEDFEQALTEAKAEGNLSRANVVRKVKKQAGPVTRDQRAELITSLAEQGYTSRQMSDRVGVTDARVREIARAYDIDIPADRMVGKTRRMDHAWAVESAVTDLENWASALAFIDLNEVTATHQEADEWVASLTNSLIELRRFIKQIKETTHV